MFRKAFAISSVMGMLLAASFISAEGTMAEEMQTVPYANAADQDLQSRGITLWVAVAQNCPTKTYMREDNRSLPLVDLIGHRQSMYSLLEHISFGGYTIGQRMDILRSAYSCALGNPDGTAPQPGLASIPAPPSSQAEEPPQQEQPELTDEQRQQQFNKLAEGSSDAILEGSDNDQPATKPKPSPAAKPKKKYRNAANCVQLLDPGPGIFQNVLKNTCSFDIWVSFCTVSPRGTGAFACKDNHYGADTLAPNARTGTMGGGVPDKDDPFKLLVAACEAPGSVVRPVVSGDKITYGCQ